MLGTGTSRGPPHSGLSWKQSKDVASGPSSPPQLCCFTQEGGAGAPGGPVWGLGRRHVTGTPGTPSLTQQLIMGSPGPFAITAAIPRVDEVDFLPLPLPQPCQLAFVSEGNRVENVTLQMQKLHALPL